jgi:hypothetical protein
MELKFPECLPKDSWFREWMEVWPTAESPKSFLLFGAMAMLGGCLGRRVWLDQDVHQVRPMLNILLIGPSGIGKSSAVKIGKRLLAAVPEFQRPQFIEGGATKEKLHMDLAENPRCILFAPELAAFFSKEKYKENLIPYVTNLLDYEDYIELRTRRDGIITVLNPSVSILGASTLEWLQDQLPDSAVSGGFLARFLILNEESKGQRVANPHRLLSRTQREKLDARRANVISAFADLLSLHEGNIDYEDYEAAETYAHWYNSYEPASGYLAPFAARAGEMILRISMLLAISCRKTAIASDHIKSAIKLYTYLASKLDRVVVATNQQGKLAALVLETIGVEGLKPGEIARKLRSVASHIEVERHIESLLYSGDVIAEGGKIKRVSD